MALLEVFGFYVAAATAFYAYIVKTSVPEEPAPMVRRLRWHRPRGRAALRGRRTQ